MKAFILAAGRGSRLGTHTEAKPKCLVSVKGTSLLDHSLRSLQKAGIKKVFVIVGYRAALIQAALEPFPRSFYETIFNPDYTRGSASSLLCAASQLDGESLILESDLLYDPRIVETLVAQREENIFSVGRFNHSREEIRVYLENGYVKKVEWGLPDPQADGEWVGFTRLSSTATNKLRQTLVTWQPEWEQELGYEPILHRLLDEFSFRGFRLDDFPWMEIDTPEDLSKAEQTIAPLIDPVSPQR